MKFQCWKCGTALKEFRSPYSRYEECTVCKADQHVCLMCREYDARIADQCREDRADFVLDKDKANFCDFFRPRAGAFKPKDDRQAREARARLAELFGESPDPDAAPADARAPQTEAERALEELRRMFGDNN